MLALLKKQKSPSVYHICHFTVKEVNCCQLAIHHLKRAWLQISHAPRFLRPFSFVKLVQLRFAGKPDAKCCTIAACIDIHYGIMTGGDTITDG